jgi:hypothetical protein
MSKWSLNVCEIQAYNIILKKCKFYATKVMYLSLIIFYNGIKMDFKKVATIKN